ncbi:MAG: hypothetical protein HY858_10935 [Candidatus Solibacter usitatus]|nr:hypothetical protein [Candidatus Solibacter usitatus]
MTRRAFSRLSLAAPCFAQPGGAARPPIPEPHFPDRLHQFVWRNWELANTGRMAEVAGCQPRDILKTGARMGLPHKPALTADQLRRIYITVIRQNWHLLPNEQIIKLLGWTADQLAFVLKEDDFLQEKVGPKPDCPPVAYAAPDAAARARAAEIQRSLRRWLGRELSAPGEPPFDFVRQLSQREPASSGGEAGEGAGREAVFNQRYIYPFFALYGDPLLETEVDPLPDGYLEKLARTGINGVWMQALLNNLAPSKLFPEYGKRSEERLANLNRLTERLARFGMKAFLYLNEPRAMPAPFFAGREHLRGVSGRHGLNAICTSVPEVREWIADSLAHIFARAPRVGGVFTITASENLTNCHSHNQPGGCPRCSQRKPWEVIAELVDTVHSGVRRSSKDAEVISWDWGWSDELAKNLIPLLPKGSALMSVSEWSAPIERGGVKSKVGEYSISVVGPGPRATAHWALARQSGVRPFAKTQFNNSWEISAVPYIPVPNLIARHCAGLVKAGVSGIQASWTVGGYPSPNLDVAGEFYFSPAAEPAEVLERVARRHYGPEAAPLVLEAWKAFSDGFEGFPYSTVPGYTVPTQHGPANLLRSRPTGVPASMILFPQDDMKRWVGPYPPAVARDLFAEVARKWQPGLAALQKAIGLAPAHKRKAAALDLAIAETCYLHFRSTADQIDFYILRDQPRTAETVRKMRAIAERQRDYALRMYVLARRHSVIAFEASNHYYYRPLDMAEAAIAAEYLLEHDLKAAG